MSLESTKSLYTILLKNKPDLTEQKNRKRLDEQRIPVECCLRDLTTPISDYLNICYTTVLRWWRLKHIPIYYHHALLNFCEGRLGMNKTKLSTSNKEQFYTPTGLALKCYFAFLDVSLDLGINLDEYRWLEPSAGIGTFLSLFPGKNKEGIDIHVEQKYEGDIQQIDFMDWQPNPNTKYVILGNPPFGLRGQLALQFINKAADFADLVGFILPPLFDSDGRGSPGTRVDKRYKLAYSKYLGKQTFLLPERKETRVNTIFQVWSRAAHDKIKQVARKTCKDYMRVYSLSDGGMSDSSRNVDKIDKCDLYLPSSCFKGMGAYDSFAALPVKRGYGVIIHKDKKQILDVLRKNDWNKTAFQSTNGATNLRISLIENVIIEQGFYDKVDDR